MFSYGSRRRVVGRSVFLRKEFEGKKIASKLFGRKFFWARVVVLAGFICDFCFLARVLALIFGGVFGWGGVEFSRDFWLEWGGVTAGIDRD